MEKDWHHSEARCHCSWIARLPTLVSTACSCSAWRWYSDFRHGFYQFLSQQDSASDRGNMEHCLLVWMKGGTLKSPESLRPRRSCKSSQSKGDHKGMGGDQQLSMEAVIGNWFKQQKYHWNLLWMNSHVDAWICPETLIQYHAVACCGTNPRQKMPSQLHPDCFGKQPSCTLYDFATLYSILHT